MKLRIVKAATIPSVITFLVLLTVVAVTCTVVGHKRRTANENFRAQIFNNKIKVVEHLSKTDIPKDHPELFLEYADKIVKEMCDSCECEHEHSPSSSSRSSSLDHRAGGNGWLEEVDFPNGVDKVPLVPGRQEKVSGHLLETVTKMVSSALRNRHIGEKLRGKIAEVMEATPTAAATAPGNSESKERHSTV